MTGVTTDIDVAIRLARPWRRSGTGGTLREADRAGRPSERGAHGLLTSACIRFLLSAGAQECAIGASGVFASCVLLDLPRDLFAKVNALHLGDRHQVQEYVGELFPAVGQPLTPSRERLPNLGCQQAELQRDVGDVEPFVELVLPGKPLGVGDVNGGSP
nr:hypothetical protein [Streptomyces sp. XY66]